MKLSKSIERIKENLKNKVRKSGLYENFGQKEVDKLKDKYIDISIYTDEMNKNRDEIQEFNDWCMNFNDHTY